MSQGLELYKPFIRSICDTFALMANIKVYIEGAFSSETEEIVSYGVSSIINYTGRIKGRFLLDMQPSVALTLTQNILGEYYSNVRDEMVLATISEMNNVIAGNAVSALNNRYSLGLWLSPPYIFTGKNAVIMLPRIQSASVGCNTLYGKLKVNIAFERGTEK
ncbi:MAG TPA: chemotaxis protein CheX [Clostridia bacterium]